jgi:hypothetical protein
VTAKVWTRAEVEALGVRTSVGVAGSIFGLCRTEAYELHKRGAFPTPVIRVGHRLVVPVQPILDLLGLDTDKATGGTSPEVPPANTADPAPGNDYAQQTTSAA